MDAPTFIGYNAEVMDPPAIKSAEQQARQEFELEANRQAKLTGAPLPFPGVWDELDPTKLSEGASPEEITARYHAFCKLCPPPQKKKYTI